MPNIYNPENIWSTHFPRTTFDEICSHIFIVYCDGDDYFYLLYLLEILNKNDTITYLQLNKYGSVYLCKKYTREKAKSPFHVIHIRGLSLECNTSIPRSVDSRIPWFKIPLKLYNTKSLVNATLYWLLL
jgi:hypothetical protein